MGRQINFEIVGVGVGTICGTTGLMYVFLWGAIGAITRVQLWGFTKVNQEGNDGLVDARGHALRGVCTITVLGGARTFLKGPRGVSMGIVTVFALVLGVVGYRSDLGVLVGFILLVGYVRVGQGWDHLPIVTIGGVQYRTSVQRGLGCNT